MPSSQPLDLTVAFDGLGRLTSQTGMLGSEAVNRSYTYDGLSRLATATGPWEKATGGPTSVTWSYTYDALGNLRTQTSSRTPASAADSRTWSYGHATKPHFLTSFAQQSQPTETLAATLGGEVSSVARPSLPTDALTWNAIGKLYRYKDSTYSYDVFGELAQTVAGPSGSQSTIVSVGDDFEVDLTNARANKYFRVGGVRIASLATSYTAPTASLPPAVWRTWRGVEPLVPPALALVTLLGLVGVGSLTLRRRTPVWLSAPGVGVLAFVLISLPSRAFAAALTTGPGKYGRHAEPFLAYLPDHLGTVRAVVNRDGIVVETRDYAPFGESIAKAGVFAVQHRFTGQPQDDQAGGLSNYGARFYNAKWGRFASPDELVQGFDSQGLNPFTYVLNRPTSATDPAGTQALGVNTSISGTDLAISPLPDSDRSHEIALQEELAALLNDLPERRRRADAALSSALRNVSQSADRTGIRPPTASSASWRVVNDALTLYVAEWLMQSVRDTDARIWQIRKELRMPPPTLTIEVEPEKTDPGAPPPPVDKSTSDPSSGAPTGAETAKDSTVPNQFPNPWEKDPGNSEVHNRARDIAIQYYMTGIWSGH